jgi:hypothetical protein
VPEPLMDVFHRSGETSCVSEFVFRMSSRDDAPQSPIFSASRRPPPPLSSESPLRAISREREGSSTPDLSPRSARIVTADLARCSQQVARLKKELSLISSSDEDDGVEWDPSGKTIKEINSFLKKWERDCRNTTYARIAKENAVHNEKLRKKRAAKATRLQAQVRLYASEEDDNDSELDEVIWEEEEVDEETRKFYEKEPIPGDVVFLFQKLLHSLDILVTR